MNPNQALWEKGDFTRIAATMRESGDALVASLGITLGMQLDLGCGDGAPLGHQVADERELTDELLGVLRHAVATP